MKFIDLFAGIGGFRLGMEQAGHECVAFCEIDKFARKSYKAIHDTESEVELHDITKVTDELWREFRGKVDIVCGGFPCQAFSVAGKREGFADETRGTLFFEIARAAKQIKPQYVFLENVKGLLNHDKGNTFRTILSTLDELGYDAEWKVCNSKNYGVPQNRERVFIVGHLRGTSRRKIFFNGRENEKVIKNSVKQVNNNKRVSEKVGFESTNRFYNIEGISPTLNTMQGGDREPKVAIPVLTPDRSEKRQNGRRFKDDGEAMFTLTSQDRHGVLVREATKKGYSEAYPGDSVNISHPNSKTRRGRVGEQVANTLLTGEEQAVVTEEFRIRKLTPKECWRLQGFPDWAFDKAQEVNSNSQLYKQAGNSVTVPVIYDIARRL